MMISLLKRISKFISDVMIKSIPLFIIVSVFEYIGVLEAKNILLNIGIPMIMAYTAGNKIEKKHGGTVAVIATLGILTESHTINFLEPIAIGAISGYVLKVFYRIIKRYEKPGYEMLINNIGVTSIGIFIFFILHTILANFLNMPTDILKNLTINILQDKSAIFFTVIIEPLKVFFLNNILNHGVFSVLGMTELSQKGKSIYFLLETNPGPGFGILMAYYYYFRKKDTLSNALIVIFGGVHEVYFVYVLKRLYLLIPLIIGSISGIYLNYIFNTGLTGIASPGSIIMIELMAPPEDRLLILFTTVFSALITFFLASVFIKKNLFTEEIKELPKNEEIKKEPVIFDGVPQNILVVCDAGMGSSAMGASFLRQKLKKKGLKEINVNNSSVENISENKTDIIVIHSEIYKRIKENIRDVEVIIIEDFLDREIYDTLIERINKTKEELEMKKSKKNENWLKKPNIKIGLKRVSKSKAIENIGNELYESGFVGLEYIESMREREEISSTYLESGIAMPHGSANGKKHIVKSGIIIHQYPYGIDYGNDKTAYILVGVAVKGDEHIEFLTKLAQIIDEDAKTQNLCMALDKEEIYEIFDWRN